MPIHELTVANFKGIAGAKSFEIRPITVFLGANSSGKSSVIHALAALAQTVKLGNAAPALVLDDDFAQVHLGRFIEIAHSKAYNDAIRLGVKTGEFNTQLLQRNHQFTTITGSIKATYEFKSTLRTQEVYIDAGRLEIGPVTTEIKRSAKGRYSGTVTGIEEKFRSPVERTKNFSFRLTQESSSLGERAANYMATFFLLDDVQRKIEEELRRVLYLGPFRQAPLRRYPFRGTTAGGVGAQGEATITLLASEHIQQQARAHMKEINAWLKYLNLATTVDLARVGSSDLFDVKLTLLDGDRLPIADLGYGLSQVLPVLTQCTYAPENATLLFEQPELHLHQGAARKLAKVFLDTAQKKSAHVVLETHSRELISEFFNHIRAGELPVEDLAIYAVSREGGESRYVRLPMTFEDGHLDVGQQWAHLLDA